MIETWIIYVAAPVTLAVLTWTLNRTGRRVDQTSKIVGLLQDEISRLTLKVDKLEVKLEAKDVDLERKSVVIQEAFKCRTPSSKCPVLTKLFEYNDNMYNKYEPRTEQQQPREHSPECDFVQGGDSGQRPGV